MGGKTASKISSWVDPFDIGGVRKSYKIGVQARHDQRVADDMTNQANEQAAAEQAKRKEMELKAQEEEQKEKASLAQKEQSRRTALTNFLAAEQQAGTSNRRFLTGAK